MSRNYWICAVFAASVLAVSAVIYGCRSGNETEPSAERKPNLFAQEHEGGESNPPRETAPPSQQPDNGNRLLATKLDAFKPVTLEKDAPAFFIPPDSRLATNEHPRILLTRGDLAILKKRLEDPRIAECRKILLEKHAFLRSRKQNPDGLEEAILWKITGDQKYIEAIRSRPGFKKNPTWEFHWAAMVDLIWDDLSDDEHHEISDAVTKAVAQGGNQYWRSCLPMVAAVYEGGKGPNDATLLERMRRDFKITLVDWTNKLNAWAAGRGGSDMGHGYNGEHAYWEPFIGAIAWSHCTGEDYIGRAEFTKYQSAFYWYHFLPDLKQLMVEKIGVTRNVEDVSAVTPLHSGANDLLFLTFTRENDGLGLAWMDFFRSREPAWAKGREVLGRLLWWNPDQQPIDPKTLPTTRLFPTSGHVIMRSAWAEDATFATFRCGRYGEIDGEWGRNHADNLSFTIRKNGPLAIDSGPVHNLNTGNYKFLTSDGEGSPGSAIRNYGRQTIAHNSILIGDGDYTHYNWQKKPSAVALCGGQSVMQASDWWKQWGFEKPQSNFMEGKVTAYRTHPQYDYILGDALHSYNPADVEEITRQFVYLKPDIFVIYDRIVVRDPQKKPCWLLHSLREPKATGEEKMLTPEEIGPQFIVQDKNQASTPTPGGHVWMGGDGFWVESGSPGKKSDGWLRVRTLIPTEKDSQRKKVGGKGHDFEVSGKQYGLTEQGYTLADDPGVVNSTIGILSWRVELRPAVAGKTVEFLHVMQVGTGTCPTTELGTLEANENAYAVKISQGDKSYVLMLNRTGARGGKIQVTNTADNRAMADESLPESVEDHWRYYKNDPHFRMWITDPRYRTVIEPTELDRKALQ